MPKITDSFQIKSLYLRNRVVMPPMCQFSAKDGMPNDWHYVHYTSRAIGGAGLIIMEMTNIEPNGRISDRCLGIWSDSHIPAFARIIQSCKHYGAKMAIQIGHAGRKAEDAPELVSASPIAFSNRYKTPKELTTTEAEEMVRQYGQAFRRALEAGVDCIEIHGAHGYLIHQFQSPFTNKRQDKYGQDKALFGVEVIQEARRVMPESMPLIFRISAIEYVEDGYGIDYSTELCRRYREAGVDMFHITAGGEGEIGDAGKPNAGPGYQVDFAQAIKHALDVPVISVGRLEDPYLANEAIESGKTDLVAVGRGMLRNPYWASDASLLFTNKYLTPETYDRAYRIPR